MSESTTTPQGGTTEAEQAEGTAAGATAQAGGENRPAGGSRTFTQDEVNSMLARERREAEARFADYGDVKAKAARLDELEQANKSELEKANDSRAKAEADRDRWKADYEALRAEVDRREAVERAAVEHGVDAAMLARMAGDVEDNALFLKAQEEARPKYGEVFDGGEQRAAPVTEEDIRAIKDPVERVRARAEFIANQTTSR